MGEKTHYAGCTGYVEILCLPGSETEECGGKRLGEREGGPVVRVRRGEREKKSLPAKARRCPILPHREGGGEEGSLHQGTKGGGGGGGGVGRGVAAGGGVPFSTPPGRGKKRTKTGFEFRGNPQGECVRGRVSTTKEEERQNRATAFRLDGRDGACRFCRERSCCKKSTKRLRA